MTAPMVDYKIHWLKMMSVPESRAVVGRHDGINGRDRFYTGLRETWERLVEEVLLSRVVERYGSDVKTQSLKRVVVDDEDYKTIFWAMKRVSERSGHDMAAAKNIPLPKIEDLKKEVTALDDYRAGLRRRSKAAEETRKMLEQPPKAATA